MVHQFEYGDDVAVNAAIHSKCKIKYGFADAKYCKYSLKMS